MTVTYRTNADNFRHQFFYLATKTVLGRILLAFMLIFPIAEAVMTLFIMPPGSKAEHFVVIAFLPLIGIIYAVMALSSLLVTQLVALIMPEITVTLESDCFRVTNMPTKRSRKMLWNSVRRMADEPNILYFYVGLYSVCIPKLAFASRDEADRFFHKALTYWHVAKGTVPPPPPAPPDISGVWPPAPQATDLQEPGRIAER